MRGIETDDMSSLREEFAKMKEERKDIMEMVKGTSDSQREVETIAREMRAQKKEIGDTVRSIDKRNKEWRKEM